MNQNSLKRDKWVEFRIDTFERVKRSFLYKIETRWGQITPLLELFEPLYTLKIPLDL